VKIACVGGGPAGLYLSMLMKLRDPEHDVVVFERNENNSASGWGVTFGQGLLRRLYDQDPDSAREIEGAAFLWSDQVTHIHGEQLVAPGSKAYNITRRRLLDILASRALDLGVRVEYGHEIASVAELPEADVVIASDGVNSRIRQEAGDFQTHDVSGSNKYIWLGTDKVFEQFNFLFVPTESGWVWAHTYGIDSASSTFIVECAPETWHGLGFAAMSTYEALPILEGIFKEHLSGYRLIGDLGDGTKARWLNFRTISNPRWHSGKVVLVGDSAHTAHFAIGMGTTLAIEDAIVLADSLHNHSNTELAFQSYEQQRKAEMLTTLTEARWSARWFENLSRYIDRRPQQFGALIHARRSPLIALLPPIVSYLLCAGANRMTFLDGVRHRVGPTVKMIYGRRKPTLSQWDAS
jgi:2-polyprenyl-6-methoxyphenol hydroxylase-like FAD-dependent oxidoreductase